MSNRQERKAEKRMKAAAKKMTHILMIDAADVIHGIKNTWSKSEREEFCQWLMDDNAGNWCARIE